MEIENAGTTDHAIDAYERTAPVYDELTAHHDYELWLGNLLAELERHGLAGDRLLDVACGTGKSFLPMLRRGWEVSAVDASAAMVSLAREKAGDAATLAVRDMRRLPRLGAFDLVWCLDDAVNYLLTPSELAAALGGFARNLRPGGLCLFDVNTMAMYESFFAEQHTLAMSDGGRLVWRGRVQEMTPGSLAEASLEIDRGAGDAPERVVHRQRHFRATEIRACLSDAGLECLAVSGHGFDAVLEQPLDEARHTKAVYVARSPEGR